MSEISKIAFNRGYTTGNENIDHFIKAVTSSKLEPDSDRDGSLSEFLDISGASLMRGDIPLFKITNDINTLLKNTQNKNTEYRPLPFKSIFIDVTDTCDSGDALKPQIVMAEISCKRINVRGFLLVDLGDCITVTSCLETIWENYGDKIPLLPQRNNSLYGIWDSNIGSRIVRQEDSKHLIPPEIKNKYKEYICNLLDFINHPNVEFVCNEKHNRNDLRLKRGMKPLFTSYSLILKGELKRYISETISNNEKAWELGHRFWVRGHWMEFKDECYKNMKGKKKWILPYIKGKGELINKEYYIGEKEQCWENQNRMIKLIQSIFPSNKIEKNNRTILNGLEIDCYLPELKLGFEYNGKQHYEWVEIFHKTREEFEAQLERDREKLKRASELGIKIITLRYDEPLTESHIRSLLP